MSKYLRSIVVLFIFISAYEWLVHAVILDELYQTTAQLWRTESDMQSRMHLLFTGHALSAFFIYLLFSRSDSTLLSDFVVFGALIGCFIAAGQLVMFSVAPYPAMLVFAWVVMSIVLYSLAGVLFYYLNK